MGFWKLLDDFWGPLEDTVNDCLEKHDRRVEREIREDMERDRIRERMKQDDRKRQ